ncbi:LRR containing protein [Entamoeba marina]
MSTLENIYLMNVVLYFIKEQQVLNFIQINKKCKEVIESMKINPFLENVSFKRIHQLFIGMETYQLSTQKKEEKFESISIIECNKPNPKIHRRFCYDAIELFAHKLRKLQDYYSNDENDLINLISKFSILRSFSLFISSYSDEINIQPLFHLKDVVTLRTLTIYTNDPIDINDIISLKTSLHNVHITIVHNKFRGISTFSNEYVEEIFKLSGIDIYFSYLDERVDSKYIAIFETLNTHFNTVLKDTEYFHNTMSMCYPTKLSLSQFEYDELETEEDNKTTTETIDLSDYLMVNELMIYLPNTPQLIFNYPTTLTSLTIDNHENNTINYDTIQKLSLLFLCISSETNNIISLPSTIIELCAESCLNCVFSFNNKWNLKKLTVDYCANCVIPICDTYKYFTINQIDSNQFVKYGDVSKISNFFDQKLFVNVCLSKLDIKILMKQNSFIEVLDLSSYDVQNFKLQFINTNKIIIGPCQNITLISCTSKQIIFETCTTLILLHNSSIDIIKGEYIENFKVLTLNLNTQCMVSHIKNYITNNTYLPQCPIEKIHLKFVKQDVIDLTTCRITKLIINNSVINKIIIPTTVNVFEVIESQIQLIEGIEKTSISNELLLNLMIKYSNGKLPIINDKGLNIINKNWILLDATNVNVNCLAVKNCNSLKHIFISKSINILVLSGCDNIKELDLIDTKIQIVNVSNCKSLESILVNDGVRLIINTCPLLK